MRHRPTSTTRAAAALALASALLGGCAEVHRGAEAVGRIGGAPAPAAEEAEAAPSRPDVKTVRPRGAPHAPAADVGDAAGAPARVASAVPSPREIFDFHSGAGPDGWRQPFVIDANDGPLAADVRRSATELRQFLADQRKGGAEAPPGTTGAIRTVKPRCGENDVAQHKPGCGPALPRAAAASGPAAPQ